MIYLNWLEVQKVQNHNAHLAHIIASFNLFEGDDPILSGLVKGFPLCFSREPIAKAVPFSLLKEHCLKQWLSQDKTSWERIRATHPDIFPQGEVYEPRAEACDYKLVLTDACSKYGVPYIELALDEETADHCNIPMAPEETWAQLKTGDKVEYNRQVYVVVENMEVNPGYCTSILSLAPAECVNLSA